MELDIGWFFENLSRKFKFHQNRTRIKSTLREEQCTFFLSYLAHFFLEWEMLETNVEKTKTHILCSVTFFRISCRLWENVEKYCRAGQAIDYIMAHAHCMLDTYDYKYRHSQYVILIAFPLRQWLHERAPVLHCTYIACLVYIFQTIHATVTYHYVHTSWLSIFIDVSVCLYLLLTLCSFRLGCV